MRRVGGDALDGMLEESLREVAEAELPTGFAARVLRRVRAVEEARARRRRAGGLWAGISLAACGLAVVAGLSHGRGLPWRGYERSERAWSGGRGRGDAGMGGSLSRRGGSGATHAAVGDDGHAGARGLTVVGSRADGRGRGAHGGRWDRESGREAANGRGAIAARGEADGDAAFLELAREISGRAREPLAEPADLAVTSFTTVARLNERPAETVSIYNDRK